MLLTYLEDAKKETLDFIKKSFPNYLGFIEPASYREEMIEKNLFLHEENIKKRVKLILSFHREKKFSYELSLKLSSFSPVERYQFIQEQKELSLELIKKEIPYYFDFLPEDKKEWAIKHNLFEHIIDIKERKKEIIAFHNLKKKGYSEIQKLKTLFGSKKTPPANQPEAKSITLKYQRYLENN